MEQKLAENTSKNKHSTEGLTGAEFFCCLDFCFCRVKKMLMRTVWFVRCSSVDIRLGMVY
jgi:hypothetical protein